MRNVGAIHASSFQQSKKKKKIQDILRQRKLLNCYTGFVTLSGKKLIFFTEAQCCILDW